MSKLGVLFPGQGAQFVGMGRELFQNFSVARDVLESANDILGMKIDKVMNEGPEDYLSRTDISQVAISVVSWASYCVLKERGVKVDCVAGLSLGEFGSLVASEVLDFEDALRLVQVRGKLMQEASEKVKGTMTAVIGMDKDILDEICRECGVEVANINCPGQIVISGRMEAIEKAEEVCKKKGAKRVIRLKVSGAFHCSLLSEAQQELNKYISELEFSDPKIRMYSSVSGEKVSSGEEARQLLMRQLISPTLWWKAVGNMQSEVDVFCELEPSGVLKGMIRKICKKEVHFVKHFLTEIRDRV